LTVLHSILAYQKLFLLFASVLGPSFLLPIVFLTNPFRSACLQLHAPLSCIFPTLRSLFAASCAESLQQALLRQS